MCVNLFFVLLLFVLHDGHFSFFSHLPVDVLIQEFAKSFSIHSSLDFALWLLGIWFETWFEVFGISFPLVLFDILSQLIKILFFFLDYHFVSLMDGNRFATTCDFLRLLAHLNTFWFTENLWFSILYFFELEWLMIVVQSVEDSLILWLRAGSLWPIRLGTLFS